MNEKRTRLNSWIVAHDEGVLAHLKRVAAGMLRSDLCVLSAPAEGLARIGVESLPDLVITYLPDDREGEIDLIRTLKGCDDAPVIVTLHDKDADDGVPIFLAGADDIVEWPSSSDELAVRLCVRLGLEVDDLGGVGGPHFDLAKLDRLGLTRIEEQILKVLYDRLGEIVSRDELSLAVDRRPWVYGDRKFDVHVAKIRKKLVKEFGADIAVSTIRLAGYRLAVRKA